MEISQSPTAINTCAVIVTYFPDNDITSRLRQIQKQLPSIFIVDNASSSNSLALLRYFSKTSSVTLLENDENTGVGRALNQAASLAIESGFSWMLTLDQDTLVHDDLFSVLTTVYKTSNCRFPLIGSNYWDVSRDKKFLTCGSHSKNFVERRTVITSGSLLNLELFKHIGNFREDYFIDSIDHEYCLRVRAYGFPVVMSCKVLMSHSIGQAEPRGNRFLAFDHPPIRKYYMARNTLVTLKCYFWREPIWTIRQLLRLAVEFLSIVFFEKDKKYKGYAFFRGIIDAIRNKMGHYQ